MCKNEVLLSNHSSQTDPIVMASLMGRVLVVHSNTKREFKVQRKVWKKVSKKFEQTKKDIESRMDVISKRAVLTGECEWPQPHSELFQSLQNRNDLHWYQNVMWCRRKLDSVL